jgi:membrane associated rhomboid family serine protease
MPSVMALPRAIAPDICRSGTIESRYWPNLWNHRRPQVPELGASGAIAAVLGAYFILYPSSRVRTYIFPVFLVQIPAWVFLGLWFLYQLIEANFGLFSASANGGGVAFFAHVGGFVFGLVAARVLTGSGRVVPQTQ